MNALAYLIRQRMTEKDWSTYDIEKKGGPPARTVAHLADPNVQWRMTPRPGTLEKLAHGLELPLKEIQKAAAQAVAGGTSSTDTVTSQYIDRVAAAMEELPEQRQAQIADFVARMIDTWQEERPPLRAVAHKGRRRDAVDVDARAAAERKKQK